MLSAIIIGDGCGWVHLFQEALQMYRKIVSVCWLSAWEWSCIAFQEWLENISSARSAVLSSGNQKRGSPVKLQLKESCLWKELVENPLFALKRWVEDTLECINNLITLIKRKLLVKLSLITISFSSVLANTLSELGHVCCWLVIQIVLVLSGCSAEFRVSYSNGYSKLLYALWYNEWPVPKVNLWQGRSSVA